MAQTEDTELRDLVIEALEKNGSLAKIRALLRANIFLAFEEECENVRHNVRLDGVLKSPEGVAALCLVHEFLEYCNLKNTLFVYKSESRQGRDYKYDGKSLRNKLHLDKREGQEPVLVALIKTASKQTNIHNDSDIKHAQECGDGTSKEDHNESYIVHSESGSPASPASPASPCSPAERTRLQLRLPLEHSDTDSSSECSRGQYVPAQHAASQHSASQHAASQHPVPVPPPQGQGLSLPNYFSKIGANTSSDSTSYVDFKPFSSMDEKMLNTPGLPAPDTPQHETPSWKRKDHSTSESSKCATLSSVPSLSTKHDKHLDSIKQTSQELQKSDGEMAEYSYDFSASQESKNNVNSNQGVPINSPKHYGMDMNKSSPAVSPQHHSHSSVSLSDVADLVSDRSSSFYKHSSDEKSPQKLNVTDNSPQKKSPRASNKVSSEDSGDYSESPVPSLSNLSLDAHSD